jgi:hypothetical protein
MTERQAQLAVLVEDLEADPEELADLTVHLRRELLGLEVEQVELARAGAPPPGSRAVDLVALGTLVVTIAKSDLLIAVVAAIRAWLAGGLSTTKRQGHPRRRHAGTDRAFLQGAVSGHRPVA